MTQGFWKVYKAKVLQTLGGESQDEDLQDEVESVSTRLLFLPQMLSTEMQPQGNGNPIK